MFIGFPTEEEWRELAKMHSFDKLNVPDYIFKYAGDPSDDIGRMYAAGETFSWLIHLHNRLAQSHWSYLMSMFYFNKGIPDEEWYISPGRKGQSVEYYPHFEDKDHHIKSLFDYFAEAFYYKLFSSWDTLGHLLNVVYELGIDRPSFDRSFRKLKICKLTLYDKLKQIIDDPEFKTMREMRHNITHNHLPGHIGSSVRRVSKNHMTFGVGSYIPSAKIKENMDKSLDLFAATVAAIKAQYVIDNPS